MQMVHSLGQESFSKGKKEAVVQACRCQAIGKAEGKLGKCGLRMGLTEKVLVKSILDESSSLCKSEQAYDSS